MVERICEKIQKKIKLSLRICLDDKILWGSVILENNSTLLFILEIGRIFKTMIFYEVFC